MARSSSTDCGIPWNGAESGLRLGGRGVGGRAGTGVARDGWWPVALPHPVEPLAIWAKPTRPLPPPPCAPRAPRAPRPSAEPRASLTRRALRRPPSPPAAAPLLKVNPRTIPCPGSQSFLPSFPSPFFLITPCFLTSPSSLLTFCACVCLLACSPFTPLSVSAPTPRPPLSPVLAAQVVRLLSPRASDLLVAKRPRTWTAKAYSPLIT